VKGEFTTETTEGTEEELVREVTRRNTKEKQERIQICFLLLSDPSRHFAEKILLRALRVLRGESVFENVCAKKGRTSEGR
jgi:hypothetical protein